MSDSDGPKEEGRVRRVISFILTILLAPFKIGWKLGEAGWAAVSRTLTFIRDGIVTVWTRFREGITFIWTKFWAGIAYAREKFWEGVISIRNGIVTIWTRFREGITFIWGKFRGALAFIWGKFRGALAFIWGKFRGALAFIWGKFRGALAFIWGGISFIWNLISKFGALVKNGLANIRSIIRKGGSLVKTGIIWGVTGIRKTLYLVFVVLIFGTFALAIEKGVGFLRWSHNAVVRSIRWIRTNPKQRLIQTYATLRRASAETQIAIFLVYEAIMEDIHREDTKRYGFHTSKFAHYIDRLAYGLFGQLFRGRDDRYAEFNRKLNQARIPVSYDIYLSRITFYSIWAATAGVILGMVIAMLLSSHIKKIETNASFPEPIGSFIVQNKVLLGMVAGALILGTLLFLIAAGLLYYWPYYVAGEREREINAMLPHSITFMYAMSRGGANVQSVVRALSQAEDSYGEVAEEFRAIVNNVEYVQEDLRTAILSESYETCSDNMQDFLEDLLNVVDAGSDLEQFFLNKADVYLEEARQEQKQLLDTLEIMSESYVTVFVASPIFILIILVVMSMMGGADMMTLYAMTYFGLPMGGLMFSLIIKVISQTGAEGHATLELDEYAMPWTTLDIDEDAVTEDPRYARYKRVKAQQGFKDKLFAPIELVRETPLYSLIVTLPIAIIFSAWAGTVGGLAEFSFGAVKNNPVWSTLVLFYIPVLMSFGTFSLLHEIQKRRERKILKRLPEAFKSASDANERGLSVEESFAIVANNSEGALAKELRTAVNEATWTANLNNALLQFANELGVARLSRTIKLITKANDVSGDVQSVLTVAARDVENMHKLDKEREQNAFTYLIIIVVSFFVSMGVIVMLDAKFLSKVAENPAFNGNSSGGDNLSKASAGSGRGGGGGGAPGMGGGGIPIEEFRMAFLHTVMVLGGASGMVAGTMAKNDPFSGIKYSLGLMGVALAVFAVF